MMKLNVAIQEVAKEMIAEAKTRCQKASGKIVCHKNRMTTVLKAMFPASMFKKIFRLLNDAGKQMRFTIIAMLYELCAGMKHIAMWGTKIFLIGLALSIVIPTINASAETLGALMGVSFLANILFTFLTNVFSRMLPETIEARKEAVLPDKKEI